MITLIIIALIVLLILSFSYNYKFKDKLVDKEKEFNSLKFHYEELMKKHPECSKCHGKGLKIVGHEVTEFGVIWKQDGTKCEACKGKGSL